MKLILAKIKICVIAIIFLTNITLIGCDQQSDKSASMGASSNSLPERPNITPNASSPVDQLPKQETSLPRFTMLQNSSYEDAGTAKITWEILVPGDITKESLSNLLNELYSQAQSKKFSEHSQATVIDIKAYMSMQHADSGMGQWIGWISKDGGQNQPRLFFDERQIDQLGKKTEDRHGFSEVIRKGIWQEGVLAEDRADREAGQKYPEQNPQNGSEFMSVFKKREELTKQLINKYHIEVAKKYGLTKNQFDEIMDEGLQKSWPFPN